MFHKNYHFFFRCIALLSLDVSKSIVPPLIPIRAIYNTLKHTVEFHALHFTL